MTTVTADNIDLIAEGLPVDQAAALAPGCITWKVSGGAITIWPEDGRAACATGGDSVWGDYYGTPGEDDFRIEAEGGVVIDAAGNED